MALEDDVAKLEADQAALASAVTAAANAIKAETQAIADLKAQLAAAGVDPALLARLEAATTGIEQQTSALTAATPQA